MKPRLLHCAVVVGATLVLGAGSATAHSLENGSKATFSNASDAVAGNPFTVELGSYGAPPRMTPSIVTYDRRRAPARRRRHARRHQAGRHHAGRHHARRLQGRRSVPTVVSRPRITGAPLVGNKLAATKGNWKNDPSSATYQWLTSSTAGAWVPIPGATSSSYKLTSEDLGRHVTVAVTAKNEVGSSQAKASPTRTVTGSGMPVDTTLPKISGRPATGTSLSTTRGTWTNKPTSYSYQWWEGSPLGWIPVAGATEPSYKPNMLNVGEYLTVIVTAKNAAGAAAATANPTSSVTTPASKLSAPDSAPDNTSAPAISGTAQMGDELSASAGTWTNSPSSYAYQWKDCDAAGSACTPISGATSSSYVVSDGDVGDTIALTVTATNAAGSATATSSPTSQVTDPPPSAPANTVLPTVSGTAEVGDQLSASEGTWTNSPSSFAYQWEDCDAAGGACTPIADATGSSYTLESGSVGSTVAVAVTATNAGGSATVTSGPTSAVTAPPPVVNAPVNTSLPQISGAAKVGDTLSATDGSWSGSPTGYTYQWSDCDSDGSNCSSISGATSSSYMVGGGDLGDTLVVSVTASNAGGSNTASSAPTAVVPDPPPAAPVNNAAPVLSGTAQVGDTLSTTNGSWSNSPTGYSYQWQDCNGSGGSCANIGGATSSTYAIQSSDEGDTLVVVVTATNSGGSASASSSATGTVPAPPPAAPVNNAAPAVSGTAQVGDTLSTTNGSWSNSPTGYSYQWQDCNSSASSCANIGGATSSTYALVSGDAGHTIVVVVTATNAGGSTSKASAATAAVVSSGGTTVDDYVAQTAAGSGNGSSCANAAAVSTLSTSKKWTAGNVIGLCGTITSTITAEGSGTSGNPITVDWEPGASVSQADCSSNGCFNTNGQSYLTLNGGSNGAIQATANGSGLANQQAGYGLNASGCNGCTIENLTIENIYRHTSASDTNGNAQSTVGLTVTGSNWVVQNNTIDNTGIGIYDDPGSSDGTGTISGNNIYDTNWGMAIIRQSSGGTIGPFYIYGNSIHDFSNWDTTSDAFHHNGLYCFSGGGASTLPHYVGFYLYDNTFGGATGADATSSIWLGGSPGGSETTTPTCADASTPWYVFNNVFDASDNTPGDAYLYSSCCTLHAYNNTFITPSDGGGREFFAEYGGTIDLRNNLFDDANQLIDVDMSTIKLSPAPDYNFFANGGSNAFVCNGYYGFPTGFSKWQSCSGGDSHGTASTGSFSLNSDGSLPSGSSAAGAGESLYSTCNGQPNPGLGALCENINGTARPSSGSWNAGAY